MLFPSETADQVISNRCMDGINDDRLASASRNTL